MDAGPTGQGTGPDDEAGARLAGKRRATPLRSGVRLGALAAAGLLAVAVLAALGYWMLGAREAWLELPQQVRSIKPYMVAVHFGLIALLWWRWVEVGHWLQRRRGMPAENLAAFLALRNRVTAFLVAFELLVVVRWPLGAW